MARFGLVGPAYQSRSVNADCQRCMNWYLEAIESGQGKGAFALYDRPGLKLFCNLGTAGGRQITTAQGRTFAVVGTKLYEISANGTFTLRGNVLSDGSSVSMANGQTQLLLASTGLAYVFDLNANTLTDISAQFGTKPVLQVGYSDGFFTALLQGPSTNSVQASNLQDATTWDALSFTGISVFTDRATAMFIDHRELWIWGPKATQPLFDSGNFPFPFDVIQGGFIESGIAATFSPAKADNSIFWLESDDRGNGMVRRANGYRPDRVSNHALEYELSTYSTLADAVGYGYKESGHEFYVLSFPTADKTWAYDTATGQWAERGYWNGQSGVFSRHRAQYHTFNFGKHLVLDPTNGNVYEQSTAFFTDAGNPLRRVRRAPHISNEQTVMRHAKLQLDVETGLGPSFQGQAQPTLIPMVDALGNLRNLGVNDGGILTANLFPTGDLNTAQTVYLNDATGASWQITINAIGSLVPVSVTQRDGYPRNLIFVSALGDQKWSLQISPITPTVAVIQLINAGLVNRGPAVTMRYSNDSARTWSQPQDRDTGQAGEYMTRVIWRRLGRARDRVYEISASDNAPCRIVDAYLEATGMPAEKRFAHEARERA